GQVVINDPTFHGHASFSSPQITLAAGTHTFDWVFFEAGGGAGGELSYDNVDIGGGRVLFGDTSQGLTFGTMTAVTWRGDLNIDINNITEAAGVINQPLYVIGGGPTIARAGVINFNNDDAGDGTGDIHNDTGIPTVPTNSDDVVLEAEGVIYIANPGQYTFGVNSDDGFSLQIGPGTAGQPQPTLSNIVSDAGSNPATGLLAFVNPRGAGTATLGVYTFTQPGFYPIRMVMFERGGGFSVEM